MSGAPSLLLVVTRRVSAPVRRVFAGFWAVPLTLAALGLAAAFGLNAAPEASLDWFVGAKGARVDATGARQALSVVGTSVMSVVSIVLSLTFVALTLVSQNLSPRMLDFVLRERVVQILIGVALATFLFSTISLTFGGGDANWRLAVAAPVALGLATLTMVTVVAFAHRMTEAMRPDEMVARRGAALLAALAGERERGERDAPEPDPGLRSSPVRAGRSGYVTLVDDPGLAQFAEKRDGVLELSVIEGDFLLKGSRIGALRLRDGADAPDHDAMTSALNELLGVSDRQEVAAGAIYEARALSEAAIRALSPGVNDPGTAIACVNRLCEGLDYLTEQAPPTRYTDAEGALRLIRKRFDTALFIARAFKPLSEHAVRDDEVLRHLTRLIAQIDDKAEGRDASISALRADLAARAEASA